MKTLEQTQEKIDKICDALRKETLEPAQKEAEEILRQAEAAAFQKIKEAEVEAEKILQAAKLAAEQQSKMFQSSLVMSAKLALEKLRQEIEHHFFNSGLEALIVKESTDPKIVAKIIEALMGAIQAEGLSFDVQASIPKSLNPSAVNALIAEHFLEKFEGKSVQVGSFKGGAQVKVVQKKLTLDMSDGALKELLASFAGKDFRNFIFNV